MIFVTIGTSLPFDRLLAAVEDLKLAEPLVVQCAQTGRRPTGADCRGPMPFDELVGHIRRARLVVTHAGAGTVLTCLTNGKKPVVVPRLRAYGEAVDDHQVGFGRRLGAAGLVTFLDDPRELHRVALTHGSYDRPLAADRRLVAELRGYIACRVAERGRASRMSGSSGGPATWS